MWVENYYGRCDVKLRDLTIDSVGYGSPVDGLANVDLLRVKLHRNGCGLLVADYGHCTASEIEVVDNWSGIACGPYGYSDYSLSRSRIEDNISNGLAAGANSHSFMSPGHMSLNLTDCLIAHKGGTAFQYSGVSLYADEYAPGQIRFQGCSIFDNWGGLDSWGLKRTTIDSCLLQNIDYDLSAWQPFLTVQYSNISHGDFVGINGNISAPALFVDPAAGDYRLRFDSPGIDVGNPATAVGALDLLGMPRAIDGDLDTIERSDIGAFEFAPLFKQGAGRLDTRLKLECWGSPGSIATIYFSRRPLVGAPQSTPFGEFDLDPLHVGAYGVSAVGQSAPVLFERLIPNTPELIGQTFSFQARTTSPLAPNGAAYTNGVQFTVLP